MHIRKGDMVEVISGDDAGSEAQSCPSIRRTARLLLKA